MSIYQLDIGKSGEKNSSGVLWAGGENTNGDRISFTNRYMQWNGKPCFVLSGEFHFSRYPQSLWEHEILKMKASGLRTVATYVFWIHHEEEEGIFDWSGNKDLRSFLLLCGKHGLSVVLRIGPFSNGECRNGGLPDWVFGYPWQERSNDPGYLSHVERLYGEIGRQAEGLMFRDGGPIIGVQLENEYDCVFLTWFATIGQDDVTTSSGMGGAEGREHMRRLKEIAARAGLDAPFYCSTAWGGSPVLGGEILPIHGAYSEWPWSINDKKKTHSRTDDYLFYDSYENVGSQQAQYDPGKYPRAEFELGGGAQHTYHYRFLLKPESVEAMAKVKIGSGANMINYYMFHGGSNPEGKLSGMNASLNYPRLSYDFQAPIGEFGQIRESCKRLKLLHYFLAQVEEQLAPAAVALPASNAGIKSGTNDKLRFCARSADGRGFLFLNDYQDHFDMLDQEDVAIDIVLPGEKLRIPETGSFTLKKNDSAIFAFNLDMDGLLLKYSLTQLITRMEDDEGSCWFFYANDGIDAEYRFSAVGIAGYHVIHGEAVSANGTIRIIQNQGISSLATLITDDGRKVRIVTLSRAEALGLWKGRFWGEDRVVISDADITLDGESLKLYGGMRRASVSIFPFTGKTLASPAGVHNGYRQGVFTRFDIDVAEKTIHPQITMHDTNKVEIRLREGALDDADEVYLKLDYDGNVARAFIGGKLRADDFHHGEPWLIGLKRFKKELYEKSMYIHISPRRKGEFVVRNVAVGLKQEFVGEETAEIRSIDVCPEYSVTLAKPRDDH